MVGKRSYILRAIFALGRFRKLYPKVMCGKNIALRCPAPPFPFPTWVHPREGYRVPSNAKADRSRGDRDDATRRAQRAPEGALRPACRCRRLRASRKERQTRPRQRARRFPVEGAIGDRRRGQETLAEAGG